MSLLKSAVKKEYIAAIKKLRLIDDTFFSICFDDNIECMQLILRLFFNRNDIIVKQVVTQRSAQNLYGRGVRFDVLAVDSKGKLYNCEVQRADDGAIAKRARYNSSMLDSRETAKGIPFEQLPETWVIFITENDVFGANLPLYHVERIITELNKAFDDAAHILYVNSTYQDNSALGLLMHDFFCTDPAKMHYKELAKRADYFKAETKGVNTMCEIMEQLQAEGRAEGRSQMAIDIAIDMLRDNKPLDEIAKYSRLPLERIQELASTLPKDNIKNTY